MSEDLTIYRLETSVDGVMESRLVAFTGNRFVGSVGVQHHQRFSAGLRQLFVDPDSRRSGIGRRLVEEACELARTSRCMSLGLTLAGENLGLFEDFYERLGFIFAYQFEDGSAILTRLLKGVA